MQSLGLSVWQMKYMVFVPYGMWGWTPWTRRSISLAMDWIHCVPSGPSFSWAYLRDVPMAGSTTVCSVQNAWAGKLVISTGELGTRGGDVRTDAASCAM
jgi:hypothetical protein